MDVEAAFIEQAGPWRSEDLGRPKRSVAFKEPDVDWTKRRCRVPRSRSVTCAFVPVDPLLQAPVRPTALMLSRGAAPPPGSATRSVARNERRKPRASERRYVGSCNELGGRHESDPADDGLSVTHAGIRQIRAK